MAGARRRLIGVRHIMTVRRAIAIGPHLFTDGMDLLPAVIVVENARSCIGYVYVSPTTGRNGYRLASPIFIQAGIGKLRLIVGRIPVVFRGVPHPKVAALRDGLR